MQKNPIPHSSLKRWIKLRKDRSFREEEGCFLIIGKVIVEEIAFRYPLETIISTQPMPLPAKRHEIVPHSVIERITGFPAREPVVAEARFPSAVSLQGKKRVLVIDQLSDPGNVGSLLRTAWGLGWEGAFLIGATADPFNDKAVRASRGAPLFLPCLQTDWDLLQILAESNGMTIYVADANGVPCNAYEYTEPFLLVMGHETKGASKTAKALGYPISIPMISELESLNVAAAGAILMHYMGSRVFKSHSY